MQDRLFLGDLVESQTAAINIIEKENKDQEFKRTSSAKRLEP